MYASSFYMHVPQKLLLHSPSVVCMQFAGASLNHYEIVDTLHRATVVEPCSAPLIGRKPFPNQGQLLGPVPACLIGIT